MELTIAPNGVLQIDDCRIVYRNFSGAATKYNREGDRNFALVIDSQEISDALVEAGWNVKIKPPREEGEEPFRTLKVNVNFNDRGPNVYLVTGKARVLLDENTVKRLDNVDIARVDMDIAPHDWEMPDGRCGRSAYLRSMKVIHNPDRFEEEFAREDEEDSVF